MVGIGAATALGSALIGAIGSANATKRARNLIDTQRKENEAWYSRKMAQDYSSRSDAQAILKKQRELLDEQYRNSRAMNTVAGGSDASLAMQQEQANKSLENTATNIAANASSFKDNIEGQYLAKDAALAQQQANMELAKSQNIAKAAGQGITAGLNLIGTEAVADPEEKFNADARLKELGLAPASPTFQQNK